MSSGVTGVGGSGVFDVVAQPPASSSAASAAAGPRRSVLIVLVGTIFLPEARAKFGVGFGFGRLAQLSSDNIVIAAVGRARRRRMTGAVADAAARRAALVDFFTGRSLTGNAFDAGQAARGGWPVLAVSTATGAVICPALTAAVVDGTTIELLARETFIEPAHRLDEPAVGIGQRLGCG